MLTMGSALSLSLERMVANSGRAGALKLNPKSASTMRLYESRMSVASDGRYDRNGMSIFSHCVTRLVNRGLLGFFG